MRQWDDEDTDVLTYEAVRDGIVVIHGHTDGGETLYEFTPLGMIRARAAASDYGYDPDLLNEAELFAFAVGMVA